MNKKVFKSMIVLVIAFLVGLYVLKIFFPQEFILAIENKNIVKIGQFLDSNKITEYLFGILTSFITYWLYCCAVCQKWALKWYECLIVLATIGIQIGLSFVDAQISYHFSIWSMFYLPFLFKARFQECIVVYGVHGLAQVLSLSIRNLPMYMAVFTSLNTFLLSIDMYLWLLLFYLYYNYNKKENK